MTGKFGSLVHPARYALPEVSTAMAFTLVLGEELAGSKMIGPEVTLLRYASPVPPALTFATKAPVPRLSVVDRPAGAKWPAM